MRRTFLLIVLAASALAAASVMVTLNAKGEGVAVSRNVISAAGSRFRFEFNCTETSHRDQVSRNGAFVFEELTPSQSSRRVVMRELKELRVEDNVAVFTGPGILRVTTGPGVQEFRGAVQVTVASLRHPEEPGDPDKIAVRFLTSNVGTAGFTFEGFVFSGDIAVSTMRSY